jgi:hypothetical protein
LPSWEFKTKKPEEIIRDAVKQYMEARRWIVKITVGNMYQKGFPDFFCTHRRHGMRWVEIKLPEMKGSVWTNAQKKEFPLLFDNGTPIWVITDPNEYNKLFGPANLKDYMTWTS